MRSAIALLALSIVLPGWASAQNAPAAAAAVAASPPPLVAANDNRVPAGELRDGVLTLRLVATVTRWRHEGQGEGDPFRIVQAFAEEGKAPQIPGPLVRVSEGTQIRMAVRNEIPELPLRLYGAMTRPGDPDAFVEIAPGATRELRFQAGKPGTYLYFGTTSGQPFEFRFGNVDTTLAGAFIVDPAGAPRDPTERIFVMTEFLGEERPSGDVPVALAINGRSWPHNERMTLAFGQPVTWRVINTTFGLHPMHLHGTFYTVESLGTWARDTLYDHDSRRLVTTEAMAPGATMTMRWVPDRVGRWLFHCHIQGHVTGDMRAADYPGPRDVHGSHNVEEAMAGLVLGIEVEPGDETAAPDLEPHLARPLTLEIDQLPNRYGAQPGYGFTIVDPELEASPLASEGVAAAPANPSPTLVLEKDEPVDLTLVNGTTSDTSIHWHGIELESYNDGVAGWSGDTRQTTKPVAAGGTLAVRFTPPRAGTFIYHTHSDEKGQLSSGMYAPLLVVHDREAFEAGVEKVILLGGSGPASAGFGAPLEINRSTNPLPMELEVGTAYRFRFINISPNDTGMVSLRGDDGPVEWRAIAKDGADLPPSQARARTARQRVSVGETYDFELLPTAPGDLRLEVEVLGSGALTTQLVRVR